MTLLFNVTKVKELMTPHPVMISPDATLEQAAKKMETKVEASSPSPDTNNIVDSPSTPPKRVNGEKATGTER